MPTATAEAPAPAVALTPDTKVELARIEAAANRAAKELEAKNAADLRAEKRQNKREDAAEKRRLKKEDALKKAADRRERKDARRAARQRAWVRCKATGNQIQENAPRLIPAGVYIAGVFVAVGGQASVANSAPDGHGGGGLGWTWPASIGAGLFIEGIAMSMALTEHRLKMRGRSGRIPQILTWTFALFAGGINTYAHRDSLWEAAIMGASSLVTIILWQIRTNAAVAEYLEAKGLRAKPRPKMGLAFWFRYPAQAFDAWSAAVAEPRIETRDQALREGEFRRFRRKARREAKKQARLQAKPLKMAERLARRATPWWSKHRRARDPLAAILRLAVMSAAPTASPVRAITATPAPVPAAPAPYDVPRPGPQVSSRTARSAAPTPKLKPKEKRAAKTLVIDEVRRVWQAGIRDDKDLTVTQLMPFMPEGTKDNTVKKALAKVRKEPIR